MSAPNANYIKDNGRWFLQTIVVHWLFFPLTMKWASANYKTNMQLLNAMGKVFWFQIGLPIYAAVLEHFVCGKR